MFKEWLTRRTTVAESERKNLVLLEELGPQPIPFGYQHQEWEAFKSKLQEGDELWEFCSPPETWVNLMGSEGICIVRDGEIIACIVTRMN